MTHAWTAFGGFLVGLVLGGWFRRRHSIDMTFKLSTKDEIGKQKED